MSHYQYDHQCHDVYVVLVTTSLSGSSKSVYIYSIVEIQQRLSVVQSQPSRPLGYDEWARQRLDSRATQGTQNAKDISSNQ